MLDRVKVFSAVDNEWIVIRSERQHLAAGEKKENSKEDHGDSFFCVMMGEKTWSPFLSQFTVKKKICICE